MKIYLVSSNAGHGTFAHYALGADCLQAAIEEYEEIFDCFIDADNGDTIKQIDFSKLPADCVIDADIEEKYRLWKQEQIGFAAHASLFDLEAANV
jgi:hypothetical protein